MFDDLLGTLTTLQIRRFGPPGPFLARAGAAADAPTLLLPRAEVPDGAKEGDAVEVFVHLDSEDRLLATTRSPALVRGEVTFLEVTSVTAIGAFVDWGLPKELLVPFREQTRELARGERHPIGLYVDSTGRLAGTMRIRELLRDTGTFELGEWVDGEAWRDEPGVGLFVIVLRAFLALVPAHEPHALARGDRARFRVTHVHPDGKIELSLRRPAHEELEGDGRRILEVLAGPRPPRVGDRSAPEQIRAHFGITKKAFKRAVGRLLKDGAVVIGADGTLDLGPRKAR